MITVEFRFRGYHIVISEETANECAIHVALCRAEFSRLDQVNEDEGGVPEVPVPVNTMPIYETITVTEIAAETMKGSSTRFYKIKGGQYHAYGIPLYVDSCVFHGGLTPANFHLQVASGLRAKVENVNGKRKVTAIRYRTDTEA